MAETPSYLRPARRRRGDDVAAPARTWGGRRAGGVVRLTVQDAIQAMLDYHRIDWSRSTIAGARTYLLGRRFTEFLSDRGVRTLDQLTTDVCLEFCTLQAGLVSSGTIAKYRVYFTALEKFCTQSTGYTSGLVDVARIPKPRQPGYKSPQVLTREEERDIVAASKAERDRLIVETFLATGVRVSELCALLVADLTMTRPPHLHVHGSVHDRYRTKSGDDRRVPFRNSYRTLPRRLEVYAETLRDDRRHRELFLSQRGEPFTVWGIEQLTQRLERYTGIHCAPHKLRHTWATRCVDAGIQPFHLQQAGGWKSIEMVRRYYTADARETLAAFARAIEV